MKWVVQVAVKCDIYFELEKGRERKTERNRKTYDRHKYSPSSFTFGAISSSAVYQLNII